MRTLHSQQNTHAPTLLAVEAHDEGALVQHRVCLELDASERLVGRLKRDEAPPPRAAGGGRLHLRRDETGQASKVGGEGVAVRRPREVADEDCMCCGWVCDAVGGVGRGRRQVLVS